MPQNKNGRLYQLNGKIFKKRNFIDDAEFIVEKDRRKLILQESHDGRGHIGIRSTYATIVEKYWWPGLLKDVLEYVKACYCCQMTSKDKPLVDPPWKIKTSGLFERFGIDFIGPLPKTADGNRYIIVAVEYLTKWAVARATHVDTAAEAAKFIFEEIVCVFGLPNTLASDRGTHFLGEAVQVLLQKLIIKHKISTPYHPQSNGLVESCNKQLIRLLRNECYKNVREWDRFIPLSLWRYRVKVNSETKISPFALLYGKEPLKRISDEVDEYDTNKRMEWIAQLNIQRSYIVEKLKLKAEDNNKIICKNFPIGPKVLLFDNKSYNTGCKLESNWSGPFTVVGTRGKSSWITHTT